MQFVTQYQHSSTQKRIRVTTIARKWVSRASSLAEWQKLQHRLCWNCFSLLLHALATEDLAWGDKSGLGFADNERANPLLILQLGRCTESTPAHRSCVWPGSSCCADGTARSVQSWIWGGAWCPAVAGQAADQTGKTSRLQLGAVLIQIKRVYWNENTFLFPGCLVSLCSDHGPVVVVGDIWKMIWSVNLWWGR